MTQPQEPPSACPKCGADIELIVETILSCTRPRVEDPNTPDLDCGWYVDLRPPHTEYELAVLSRLTTD